MKNQCRSRKGNKVSFSPYLRLPPSNESTGYTGYLWLGYFQNLNPVVFDFKDTR